jgi:hypothetical protein
MATLNPAPFHERLHKNYCAHIKQELQHVTAIKPIHVLTPPDIPLTRQRAYPIHSWVPAHNPFAFPNTPSLPRWERILKNFLDNNTTPTPKKVQVFATMAQAYNDEVYRPAAESSDQTEAFSKAYGPSLKPYASAPSFVNYALSVLTRSLNVEEDTDSDSSDSDSSDSASDSASHSSSSASSTSSSSSSASSSSPPSKPSLTEEEIERLRRFGHIWFYALLQGSKDCILVGYHNVDPWHLWMGFVEHIPVPMLWQAMVLQYISYESRFNFMYPEFFRKDLYAHLSFAHGSTCKEADPTATAFVHATTDFKTLYEELKCAPHATNPLFVAIE